MNLANKLTIFRVILVPVFVIIGYLGDEIGLGIISGDIFGISWTMILMGVVFGIAAITDKLDGHIARSRNQVTTLGKFLDPLADKILVLSALVMLVQFGKIPAWIPVIVLAREFIVSGYRLVAVEKGGQVIAASFWGKLKTATQMVAIIGMFLDKYNFCNFILRTTDETVVMTSSLKHYLMSTPEYLFNILVSLAVIASVIATIFSGWDYLKNGKDLFKE